MSIYNAGPLPDDTFTRAQAEAVAAQFEMSPSKTIRVHIFALSFVRTAKWCGAHGILKRMPGNGSTVTSNVTAFVNSSKKCPAGAVTPQGRTIINIQ